MTKEEIKIPAMGESVTEAEISSIIKPSGSAVQESDELIELETEKVNQVLYAPFAGVVQWTVQVGDTVRIGDVIGHMDSEEAPKAEAPSPSPPTPTPVPKAQEGEAPTAEAPATSPPPTPPLAPKPVEGGGARLMESEFLADLQKPPAKRDIPPPSQPPQKGAGERETRSKMTKIRKTIANRLVDALHSAAMLTTFNEVDMSVIIALRAKYKESFLEQHGVKLGFMSFFVKAVVAGLKAMPDFNSYIDGEEIVHREYFDIGIAVGTDRGLMVPVLRGCDQHSFAQIEQAIVAYAQKARSGKLTIDDLEGGGFTITNGGIYGSLLSTPILNPPQVGILGMHKIMERPIVLRGEVVVRPMMYLALSYDHRIVDGKEAVTFLIKLKEVLEDPASLLFSESDG